MSNELLLPATNTLEQNALLWATYHNNLIESGHGFFFDFKQTPELQEPALNCLINNYGLILEKPFFIRKPQSLNSD